MTGSLVSSGVLEALAGTDAAGLRAAAWVEHASALTTEAATAETVRRGAFAKTAARTAAATKAAAPSTLSGAHICAGLGEKGGPALEPLVACFRMDPMSRSS